MSIASYSIQVLPQPIQATSHQTGQQSQQHSFLSINQAKQPVKRVIPVWKSRSAKISVPSNPDRN